MTREEKEQTGKYVLQMARLLEDGCYQQEMLLKAVHIIDETLEQESCGDEYIKIPKKALKYRTAGMVAYNAEWLKNNFDIERAVICGEKEACGDAISRQAVIDVLCKAGGD